MKALTAAMLSLCVATSAFAQKAPGTDSTAPSANPAAGAPTAGSTASPAATTTTPSTASAANARFITTQTQDQWLVGNLWNKKVYNASGQSIGDMKDVLVDKEGKVAAIVIGVGGFLGLGEKNVAVDYNFIKQNGGITGDRIVLNMSEQDLRSAPDFQRIKPSSSSESSRSQ
jgi:sporulation protein YlmC with PRC-barrel domain